MVDAHRSYHSYCSHDPKPDMFKSKFKICPVAQKIQMKKSKSFMFYVLHPSSYISLEDLISLCSWFSVSFERSFNYHQQKCQMDVNMRYWKKDKNNAISTYYNFRFLLWPNAGNLTDKRKNRKEKNIPIVSSRFGSPLFLRKLSSPFLGTPLSKANFKSYPLFLRVIQTGACKL